MADGNNNLKLVKTATNQRTTNNSNLTTRLINDRRQSQSRRQRTIKQRRTTNDETTMDDERKRTADGGRKSNDERRTTIKRRRTRTTDNERTTTDLYRLQLEYVTMFTTSITMFTPLSKHVFVFIQRKSVQCAQYSNTIVQVLRQRGRNTKYGMQNDRR